MSLTPLFTRSFARLQIVSSSVRSISSNVHPMLFKFTPCLFAEPLKKKKRIDPAIVKQREERRKRKIERQIRRLEKVARQFKPIDELEVPLNLIDQEKERRRNLKELSEEEQERRALILKEWGRYRHSERLNDFQLIDRVIRSQQKAMDELRMESEELYQAAIQLDPEIMSFKGKGPVWTPPIENYDSPDGEYIDTSKKWE